MYPPVTQFETRRREERDFLRAELAAHRDPGCVDRGRVWAAVARRLRAGATRALPVGGCPERA